MSKKRFTRDEVIAFLKKQQGGLSLSKFAAKLGTSKALLWQVYNRKVYPNKSSGFKKLKAIPLFERIEAKDDLVHG
jgi:hypothetical protein